MSMYSVKLLAAALTAALVLSPVQSFAGGSVSAKPVRANSSGFTIPKGQLKTRLPTTTPAAVPVGGSPANSVPPRGEPSLSRATGVAAATTASKSGRDVGSNAFGVDPKLWWPYSTARVASSSANEGGAISDNPVTSTPYRQTGKLVMRFDSAWYVCTASLVKPSVLVTAAHCVHEFGLGDAGFADEVYWIPANTEDPLDDADMPNPGAGVFGLWAAIDWYIPTSYYNGTDTCDKFARGVVCNNDLALIVLETHGSVRAGEVLGGTYGYEANGYGFIKTPAFKNTIVADITQLGYPAAFDNGWQMQRNNSFGKYLYQRGKTTSRKPLLNIQLGSAMTGGSSGGPWLVNFGTRPSVDSSASLGYDSDSNIVVGVTSWGYSGTGVNVQGSSFFGQNYEYPLADYGGYGAGNIGSLMQDVCNANPSACQ